MSNSTNKDTKTVAVNRKYKSRIFEMIFSDKKELLLLYNAVNNTNYQDPEALEINTLENAIYMSMHNDVSFVIDSRLSLYEHQSTINPNLPLRYLIYISDLYSAMTKKANLYGETKVMIPPPKFLIFYNGAKECSERQILKLSDLYTIPEDEASLDLTAIMLNINPGYNEELKASCKTLADYVEYTSRVRCYAERMTLESAVDGAIDEGSREGILADFLLEQKAEAKAMSIYEYDEEMHMMQTREEGYARGVLEGKYQGTIETCIDLDCTKEDTIKMLTKKYDISEPKATSLVEKYWKQVKE